MCTLLFWVHVENMHVSPALMVALHTQSEISWNLSQVTTDASLLPTDLAFTEYLVACVSN